MCSAYFINMVSDFHNDILTASGDLKELSQSVSCCVCALFRGGRSFQTLRETARKFLNARPDNLFLGLEDIGYFEDGNAAEICSWRPVYASLTWNGENALAGGCESDGRLTEKGRGAVKALSEHKICIDCAHLNRGSFADVLDCGVYGLLDSHTCLSGVCRHPRNLEDWQVREIAARGGLVGICFVGRFLKEGGNAGVEDVFRHIDYGVQKFGVRAICLGSDFNGTDDLPQGIRKYEDLYRLRDRMLHAHYKDADADAILKENLKNFLNLCANNG